MIAGTYLGSAALVAVLGVLLLSGSLTTWSFMALVLATFFLASAGASSAYLTVSEVFPMETRALAIALFFAVGTAVGGIAGPALFGQFIHSGDADLVALGFFIGAAAMALGGVAELLFGVRAEQQSLEAIATPAHRRGGRRRGSRRAAGRPARAEAERDERIRARAERARPATAAGCAGCALAPGAGSAFYSPGMVGSVGAASRTDAMADRDRDREIEAICARSRPARRARRPGALPESGRGGVGPRPLRRSRPRRPGRGADRPGRGRGLQDHPRGTTARRTSRRCA